MDVWSQEVERNQTHSIISANSRLLGEEKVMEHIKTTRHLL